MLLIRVVLIFFFIFFPFKEDVEQNVGLPALLPYSLALSPRTQFSGSSQASPRGFERYQKDTCGTRGGDLPKKSDKVISLEVCTDSNQTHKGKESQSERSSSDAY